MELPATMRRVLDSVLGPRGHARAELRRAVAARAAAAGGAERDETPIPGALEPYVDKVIHSPWKVLDRDVEALRAEGLAEDEIFELTIATAIGSAVGRYERALNVIGADAPAESQGEQA